MWSSLPGKQHEGEERAVRRPTLKSETSLHLSVLQFAVFSIVVGLDGMFPNRLSTATPIRANRRETRRLKEVRKKGVWKAPPSFFPCGKNQDWLQNLQVKMKI